MRLRPPAPLDARPRAQETTPTCAATTAAPTAASPPNKSTATANGSTSAKTASCGSSRNSSCSASSDRCDSASSPKQLRAHERDAKQNGKRHRDALRRQIADLDRRIGLRLNALEKGIDPELVGARIAELRAQKEQLEEHLREQAPDPAEHEPTELLANLERLPDLSQALRDAPPALKRQIFDASELRILYDEINRRIEISATISDAVARTLQNANDLPEEVVNVTQKGIAGAGFEPATFGL